MPKTVLIILAAVVALIVIVVLTGMRYLRTDDDDFDDDAPAEHGHVRNRGTHPIAEQHVHRRARHDAEMPDERRKERVGVARDARPAAGYGGERGPDRRGAPRSGHDRGWREDSDEITRVGQTPRSGREPTPVRELPVRAGRGDRGDISEPMAASARSASSKPGRGASRGREGLDSQPTRVGASARGYGRDTPDDRERRDDRDRLAGREEADFPGRRGSRDHRDSRDGRDSRDARDSRDSRDSRDRREARPAASVREIGDPDERDRRGATRPNARPDARRNGARSERGELLPAVKPRQAKSKRDSDGDWPTNEWDELSDVDYWAELASDKPLTTAVPSGQVSRAQARESRQDARPSPDRHERKDGNAGAEVAVRQPRRRERNPDQATLPPVTRPAAARPAAARPAAAMPAAARPATARPAAARPVPDDDDPLTSPSFPRIAADDSRSYRRTRAASDAHQPTTREPDALQSTRNGGYAAAQQAEPHTAYPAAPRVESVSGLETASYPLPAAGAAGYGPPTGGYSSADSGTASYSIPPASLPTGATSGYPAARAEPPHSAPGGSYELPGNYPPAARAVTDGYSARGGIAAADYLPSVPGSPGSGAYPGALADAYPPVSSPASYAGAGGYSLPAHSSVYDNSSGYDNGYPDQAPGYQGYGESGSSSGSHLRPEAGYQAGPYPGNAEPSFGAALPGGHGDLSYPAYPAPMPAEHGAAYQATAQQLPGYQDPAYQAGSPAPAHETDGYAGADPYAADPYGEPDYGGNGY